MSDISRLEALLPQIVLGEQGSTGFSTSKPLSGSDEFTAILKQALNGVNEAQFQAEDATKQVLRGESTDIHETMIALKKADISLKMMLEVRNKVLEAYQEVMRTQM